MALGEDASQNFKWTCNGCKQNFPSMTNLSAQLKSIEEKTHGRINEIENNLKDLNTNIGVRVKQEVSDFREDFAAEMKEMVRCEVRKEVREIDDQKNRSMNLLVFNLPESQSPTPKIRKDYDSDMFLELCGYIGLVEIDIKLTIRLGNHGSKKPRPLKVILNNKRQRKEILNNASKIRTIPKHSKLANCIIAKDLTPQQRLENKNRKEKKKEEDKGQTVQITTTKDKQETNNLNTIETVAIVENIDMSDIMDSQSQPLLGPLHTHQEPTSPEIIRHEQEGSEYDEETVIGGFSISHSTTGKYNS